jgi:hypothetical protein
LAFARVTQTHLGLPGRDAARTAAKLAASEQAAPRETTQISYEDKKGRRHNKVDSSTDRCWPSHCSKEITNMFTVRNQP